MSAKLQIAIYRVQDEYGWKTVEDACLAKGYQPQTLQHKSLDSFNLGLFYRLNTTNPKWKDFLRSVTESTQDILKKSKSKDERFVLLLENTISKKLYAVTGGFAFGVIQDFIDDEFGIDVFSRLIKKDEKILKASREKSVTGGILGTAKYFRSSYTLFENDSFGKIYKEITASLKKDVLTDRLGFTPDEIRRDSVCVAKSTFKVSKNITFPQLLGIIKGCESIIATEKPIPINSVEKLAKKKHQSLISELGGLLLKQLWERFQGKGDFDFDLCHSNFEEYLVASKYEVRKGFSPNNFFKTQEDGFEKLDNIEDFFEELKISEKKPENEEKFSKLIHALKIFTFDENGKLLTEGKMLEHIFGDVQYKGKRYFYIDSQWYEIKKSFIDNLDASCASFFENHYHNIPCKNWKIGLSENGYNQEYIGQNDTIVLDRVTPDNIEVCDVLSWDKEHLYFYHVKSGFSNTTRDLCEQINISARRLQHDKKTDFKFAKKLYAWLKQKAKSEDEYFKTIGMQTNQYTEEFFTSLFKKKHVFVLAVADKSKPGRNLQTNIKDFGSCIAKFSVEKLSRDMREADIEFRAIQIWRS